MLQANARLNYCFLFKFALLLKPPFISKSEKEPGHRPWAVKNGDLARRMRANGFQILELHPSSSTPTPRLELHIWKGPRGFATASFEPALRAAEDSPGRKPRVW